MKTYKDFYRMVLKHKKNHFYERSDPTMLIIICFVSIFGRVVLSLHNDQDELLSRTLNQLKDTFNFVLNDYDIMNVDGILGINVACAHLRKAVLKATDLSTNQKLIELIDQAETIYALQGPNLQSFPYKYYVFNTYVIPPEVWERDIKFSYGKLNPNPKVYPGQYNLDDALSYTYYIINSTFNEEQSDACLVEVAAASDDTEPHDCSVSDTCVDYMLKLPTKYSSRFPGYGVTHMALFLQIARNRNCNMDYSKVNKLLQEECSYILWELKKNVKYGYISNLDDLLMEQIDLCGYEGFGEFLEKNHLEHILSVQNSHGGFGINVLTKKQILNRNRPKRESNIMKYGANSHTTGLAASVLALYVRLLIEKPFSNKAFYQEK